LREERQFGRGTSGNIGARRTIIRNHFTSLRSKKRKLQSFAIYGGIFLLTISFLIYGNSGSNVSAERSKTLASSETTGVSSVSKSAKSKTASVDELAAANAVTNLAETAELPSAGDLRESETSLTIKKSLSQNDAEVITKPDIVKPDTSAARGISSYVTKEGDTMESIAKKFKISSQTLRWANNTTSDAVEPNKTLVVPLVDGIVYTIKDGDTAQSLAEKYKTSAERVVLYNDIDDGAKLSIGSRIVLPGGELPENERPGYVASRSRSTTTNASRSWLTASVGNRYAAGNCTWYAYERRMQLGRPIGSFWGNANTWATSARAAGFVVNNTPAPGAIFQTTAGYYGHVGIVERVENGVVYVSDMNYAGYGIITHRTLNGAGGYLYIH
jgi:N-acetylmuramoyl-L-alanine amidase